MITDGNFKYKAENIHYSPVDLLVIGATGSGKSSTINILTGRSDAIVGDTADPQTITISNYNIGDQFRIWDTPGLGDSTINDNKYLNDIRQKIYEKCTIGSSKRPIYLIDVILLVINGSSRDFESTYKVLSIIDQSVSSERILIGINFADLEMSGLHWDSNDNSPDPKLQDFIYSKEESTRQRIHDNCGLFIKNIITYSALYKYNITALECKIINMLPNNPREIK